MSAGRYKKADYFCFFVFIGVGQTDDELFYLIEAVLETLQSNIYILKYKSL